MKKVSVTIDFDNLQNEYKEFCRGIDILDIDDMVSDSGVDDLMGYIGSRMIHAIIGAIRTNAAYEYEATEDIKQWLMEYSTKAQKERLDSQDYATYSRSLIELCDKKNFSDKERSAAFGEFFDIQDKVNKKAKEENLGEIEKMELWNKLFSESEYCKEL